MAIVLSVNCGSSSLKYQLIDMPAEKVLAKGLVERIGLGDSIHTCWFRENKLVEEMEMEDHEHAVKKLIEVLLNPKHLILRDIHQIVGIGHRFAHGGERFVQSTLVTDKVLEQLEECADLAPLHNPANLAGIRAFKRILPDVPSVAVFDTAFHQSMAEKTFLYSLPYEYYRDFAIRKYGFHGTSHQYVTQRAAALIGRPLRELRLISCHLGNGASIAAVKGGKTVDTSMGFTPLAGIPMGTRCGDIDPAIIPFLMDKTDHSVGEVMDILNKRSGLLGISGVSSDLREIEQAAEQGDRRARLAMEVLVERICSYIGSYIMQMEGLDAIIFTAGIGENSPLIRSMVLKKMEWIGIYFSPERNQAKGMEKEITFPYSPVQAFVIPTNEEMMIARDTVKWSHLREKRGDLVMA